MEIRQYLAIPQVQNIKAVELAEKDLEELLNAFKDSLEEVRVIAEFHVKHETRLMLINSSVQSNIYAQMCDYKKILSNDTLDLSLPIFRSIHRSCWGGLAGILKENDLISPELIRLISGNDAPFTQEEIKKILKKILPYENFIIAYRKFEAKHCQEEDTIKSFKSNNFDRSDFIELMYLIASIYNIETRSNSYTVEALTNKALAVFDESKNNLGKTISFKMEEGNVFDIFTIKTFKNGKTQITASISTLNKLDFK